MMGSLRSQFFLTKKLNEAIMRGPGSPASFLFRLIIPLTAAFVITILALIATLFGDERAPFPRLLNRYGNVMLVVEFLAIVVVTLMAIMQDQKRIRAGESGADVADDRPRVIRAGIVDQHDLIIAGEFTQDGTQPKMQFSQRFCAPINRDDGRNFD